MTRYDYQPDIADDPQVFRQDSGQDSARLLVHNSELFHRRPYLQAGDDVFLWPVGTEGFRISGNSTLGLHHYIGDDDVDVQVLHRSERRIEISGTFPGRQSAQNKEALEKILRKPVSDPGKILFLPGILERVQYVEMENYEFTHEEDDRTHSISYTVTFIRMGTGRRTADPKGKPAPPNPSRKRKPRGKAHKYVIAKVGLQTFRQVARKVWGDADKWPELINTNMAYHGSEILYLLPYQLPTYRWPLGTKIYY